MSRHERQVQAYTCRTCGETLSRTLGEGGAATCGHAIPFDHAAMLLIGEQHADLLIIVAPNVLATGHLTSLMDPGGAFVPWWAMRVACTCFTCGPSGGDPWIEMMESVLQSRHLH